MKLRQIAIITVVFALAHAGAAEASIGARAGLPEGFSMGLGAPGISIDGSLGAFALGGVVLGQNLGPGNLIPTLRAVWTIRNRDNLSVGMVTGGTYASTFVQSKNVESLVSSPIVRSLVGDIGLTASYRFDLPLFFDRVLPLTLTPTVTFMLDGTNNLVFGPQTSVELAARLSPDVELTLGGGTIVGLRFKI